MNREAEIKRAARAIATSASMTGESEWRDWTHEATAAITPLLDRIDAMQDTIDDVFEMVAERYAALQTDTPEEGS